MAGSNEQTSKDHGGESAPPPRGRPRLETGLPRLDYILQGGFLRGGIYSLMGPPGSGKTILCNQACSHHVAHDGGRAVYMTLLVESHAKMIEHLSSMTFFKPELVPDKLYYVSGYLALRKGGLDGLLELIRESLRERRPSLFVIDGLDSVASFAPDERAYKEFLHALQGFTAMIDCTTILASSHGPGAEHPENSLVDGVLELSDHLLGPRAVRELTVHKFRGSDYLRGRHEVEIKTEGMVIHPRTEIQFDKPPQGATEKRVRMAFGIPALDAMMDGGLMSGSTTALLGAPGAGKTLLGLHFLVEGARGGQKGIYFGFYEPPPRLIEKVEAVGIPLKKYVDAGMIELIWQPPLEHYLDSLAEQLLEKIKENPESRRRLFIDGIEGFRAATVYPDRMPRFLSAFTNQLRMQDVTTLVSEELALFQPTIDMPNPELANVVESVLLLRYVELRSQIYRLLSIMKMRESRYDTAIREFRITDDGIDVANSFETAESILTGSARIGAGGAAARPATKRARGATGRAGAARRATTKKRGRSGR